MFRAVGRDFEILEEATDWALSESRILRRPVTVFLVEDGREPRSIGTVGPLPAPEETLGEEHMRRVHGDGSECPDGCDAAPLPDPTPECAFCSEPMATHRDGRPICLECGSRESAV